MDKYDDGFTFYRVGWLEAFNTAWKILTMPYFRGCRWRTWRAARPLGTRWNYFLLQAKRGNWRAVRMMFNGWMYEPYHWDQYQDVRRCGTGWTRGRAIRSWNRQVRIAELYRSALEAEDAS